MNAPGQFARFVPIIGQMIDSFDPQMKDSQIMISHDHGSAQSMQVLNTFRRIRAITNSVPQAYDPIREQCLDFLHHRLQGVPIAVNVRYDCDFCHDEKAGWMLSGLSNLLATRGISTMNFLIVIKLRHTREIVRGDRILELCQVA
jgi:hypothetical protein